MNRIPNEQINEIRNSVNIVDLVSQYIPLTKKGKNYFGVCPFHEDSDPSLSVSPEKQIFSCFSCHTSGNIFKFIMEYEHVSFIEAVNMTANMAGIKLDIKLEKNVNYKSKSLYEIYELSQKFYANNINTNIGSQARDYLNDRKINDDLIKEFEIGLSLKSNNKLSNLLIKKDFKEKDLIESSLIVKDERGFHDFFYNRIMFPLYDINNQVIGYSARLYDGSDGPKYINSKEHPAFKKGTFIYNYYKAKGECRVKNTVIIMEGFMDVIRAYSVGVKNTVATMGTAFTKEHISLIKKLASNIIICFDGDNAGVRASIACIDELLKADIIPKVVYLEENLDPDDYILKYGENKFIDKIDNALSVMDFKLMYYKKDIDIRNSEQQSEYVKQILLDLNKMDDDILREITIKKLSKETLLDEDFLRSKLNKNEPKKIIKKIIKNYSKYELAQLSLLFYMLRYPDVIRMYDNQVFYFPNPDYRMLAKEISCFYNQKGYINEAEIMDNLDNSLSSVIGQAYALNLSEEYTTSLIEDYIDAIKENNIEVECKRLTEKMENTTDEEEKLQLALKIMELLKRREKDV